MTLELEQTPRWPDNSHPWLKFINPSCEVGAAAGTIRLFKEATQAEAYLGLGQDAQATNTLKEAYATAPQAYMKASTEGQLAKLRELLVVNPLRFINATQAGA